MAFEEWLALGGNEIINNARTVGYALSADCPMAWFKSPPCSTLWNATVAAENWDSENIERAPWYDAALPDVSRRFYGAYGISVKGIEDSTRTATVTSGLADGGVIGRVRKAPREVRVTALLAGEGQDAIEYGMAWLSAALDPNACGQHGDACGTADLSFFSTCPPEWPQVPVYTEWAPAGANLATNPSMETVGGAVEVRRNEAGNPRALTTNHYAITGTGTTHAVSTTETHDEHNSIEVTTVGTAASEGLIVTTATAVGTPGKSYGGGIWVKAPVGAELYATVRTTGATSEDSVRVVFTGTGDWQWVSTGLKVAQSDATSLQMHVRTNAVWAGTFNVAQPLMGERSIVATADDYFDGESADQPDITFAWSGAADASASVASGFLVDGISGHPTSGDKVVASQEWASTGSQSARLLISGASADSFIAIPNSWVGPATPGRTVTMLAKVRMEAPLSGSENAGPRYQALMMSVTGVGEVAGPEFPNEPGIHELRWTYTFPAASTGVSFVRLYAGHSEGQLWLDDFLVIDGPWSGPYFDGDTEDTDLNQVEWTGAPHASTTSLLHRDITGTTPIPVEEYLFEVGKVRRFLHDVAAVSGPLIQQEAQSGKHWAYIVEYTLVAGNPYVYGATNLVAVEPRIPVIVQDIPYNLVTHPSAEKSAGTIVVATNYATNPSGEVDATGWSVTYDGTVITTGGSAPASSTDIAVVGAKSVKTTWTAPAAGAAAGWVGLQHEVALPHAAVAGERYSINLWANSSAQAGAPVWGNMDIVAYWRAGGATVRTDPLDTIESRSGAASVPSIEPPVGATSVIVRVKQYLTSWPAGTIVRVYADALAVTNP